MPRLQLIEIHEQPWCPQVVRDGTTECLNMIATTGRQYGGIVPHLYKALRLSPTPYQIVDLGSGSGGPWLTLYAQVNRLTGQPIRVLLTDLYPSAAGMAAAAHHAPKLAYYPAAVDATHLPPDLVGFRTLFTAFHHFPPHAARAILQDAVNQRQGIALFEQTQRSWQAILLMFILPWIALLITPFMRPFRLSRILFTYLLPIIPLVLCIDGIVSCLRTYSPDEMEEMIAQLEGAPYHWEIGQTASPFSPLGISYTIGYPQTSPRVSDTK